MPKLPGFVGLHRLFGVQSATEVIDYWKQLPRYICDDAAVSFPAFAFDSLAIVFKVRLTPRQGFLCFIQCSLEALKFGARSDEFCQLRPSEACIVVSGIDGVGREVVSRIVGSIRQFRQVCGVICVVSIKETNGNAIRLFLLSI
jgi:hypothetical protein